ncbi:hypothetical protein DPMN_056864 [Dreissena polymorpha]|uniref:Uncharacterized protein n=1 Tax=Dreissena polymorpha TaxID=45954 RepID=A0A9D4CV68_DREPO|nr:hypothetical protein DPMN_056864 [Dreissena polymorpha]
MGDLGHPGCLTPIATSLQCLPSALRKGDNQCPPSAFMQGRQTVSVSPLLYARETINVPPLRLCKEDNRSVLYKRHSVA